MRLLLIVLALTPFAALADTFLCVPDAGAMVRDAEAKRASAHIVDVSQEKFILTRENGNWGVKALGDKYSFLDHCLIPRDGGAPHLCQSSRGHSGIFFRNDDGRFSITWLTADDSFSMYFAAKGRCSKI